MDHIERRDRGMVYISDDSVMDEQKPARRLTQQLNTMDRADFDGIREVVKQLLGRSENAFINPPFYCDYGFHIEVGKNFFANYNCVIVDTGYVRIGDNVWIGGNSVVLPGVTIGSNTVIGAGSVVNRDIPEWCVAAGNPCRVIRRITEEDRWKYFSGKEIDEEARRHIIEMRAIEQDPVKYPAGK